MIDIAFGGMVAEELFFGECSTGVASDLQAATLNACQMVGQLGMGISLVSVAAIEHQGGGIVGKVLADEQAGRGRGPPGRLQALGDPHAGGAPPHRRGAAGRPAGAQELIGDEILDVIGRAVADPDVLPATCGTGPAWPTVAWPGMAPAPAGPRAADAAE